MEYKLKVIRRRKAKSASNKAMAGKIRVKVRGRKRWITPKTKDA